MSFPIVSKPALSPSLGEFDLPTIQDQNGYTLPLIGVVTPDANGNTTLPTGAGLVVAEANSQVTGKRQAPQVGPSKIPTFALVGVDPTTGVPIPFVASASRSVSGKFQSAVTTGTGSSQSIPHGLGVTPSMVLIAPYDNTASGSTPFTFVIAEGVHTSSNVLVTATSGLKYKVIAFV